jgi:hypothetical protein
MKKRHQDIDYRKEYSKMKFTTTSYNKSIGSFFRGKKLSEEHCEKVSVALKGRAKTEEHAKKIKEFGNLPEERRARSERFRGDRNPLKHSIVVEKVVRTRKENGTYRVSKEQKQLLSEAQLRLIAEGNSSMNRSPFGLENFPLERILDLLLLIVFMGSYRYDFRKELIPPDSHSLRYQVDFICRLLKLAIEGDECRHENEKTKAYDRRRDNFFIATDFDFVYRYKQLRAEIDLVNIVKEIYDLCNKQREKYQLWYLPILVFDDRWISYLEKMQELLRDFRLNGRNYKKFQEKKCEIDKQYLWLLEDLAKDQQSLNFASLVREALESDCVIKQKLIESPWRK